MLLLSYAEKVEQENSSERLNGHQILITALRSYTKYSAKSYENTHARDLLTEFI